MNHPETRLYQADARLPISDDTATIHRYGFKINTLCLTYPPLIASEVIKVMRVCHIPHSPHWVHGVINVRGHLIPAFDLHTLLYNQQATGHLFLVLGQGSTAAAICINDFPVLLSQAQEVSSININKLSCPPMMKDYIKTYFQTETQTWLEIDMIAFFSSLKH